MHAWEAMLALKKTPGLGPVLIKRLLKTYNNDPFSILKQESNLLTVPGITTKHIQALKNIDWEKVKKECQQIKQKDFEIITICDKAYPQDLLHIYTSPSLLYVSGKILERDLQGIAIVGTRRPSVYGQKQAYKLAYELAQKGITIVSGLAYGIDAAAHRGALAAQGRTLAVLGSGFHHLYPKSHCELAQKIVNSGALISEYSLETKPLAANFPRRNRIISALSKGTLVVEAGAKSGALITASYALEQGKEVFALPGTIDNPLSMGPNNLIREGAKLVIGIEDILEEFPGLESVKAKEKKQVVLKKEEQMIWDELKETPLSIEVISQKIALPPHQISSLLVVMQLKGLVINLPGQRYAKAH